MNEGGKVLTDLVHALEPAIDHARSVVDGGRALVVVRLSPFRLTVTLEGRNGEALRALERDGDAELGTAAAAFVEFALRNHTYGAALGQAASAGSVRFIILFDEGEHRACLRAEMPEGSAKIGELRGELTAH